MLDPLWQNFLFGSTHELFLRFWTLFLGSPKKGIYRQTETKLTLKSINVPSLAISEAPFKWWFSGRQMMAQISDFQVGTTFPYFFDLLLHSLLFHENALLFHSKMSFTRENAGIFRAILQIYYYVCSGRKPLYTKFLPKKSLCLARTIVTDIILLI